MPDKYDALIDSVSNSQKARDKYDSLIDSIAGKQNKSNVPEQSNQLLTAGMQSGPNETARGYQTASMLNMPEMPQRPDLDISPMRALITNEPTSGITENLIRGIPASAGAGLLAGTGLIGTGGMASIPLAGVGAAGG